MERTQNMPDMVVTLDVSRLSSWLNADALCRVKEGIQCGARCEVRDAGKETGGREVVAEQAACWVGDDYGGYGQGALAEHT